MTWSMIERQTENRKSRSALSPRFRVSVLAWRCIVFAKSAYFDSLAVGSRDEFFLQRWPLRESWMCMQHFMKEFRLVPGSGLQTTGSIFFSLGHLRWRKKAAKIWPTENSPFFSVCISWCNKFFCLMWYFKDCKNIWNYFTWNCSLRSKRLCLVSERRKIEERDFCSFFFSPKPHGNAYYAG